MSYFGIVRASTDGTVDPSINVIAAVITGMGHTYTIEDDVVTGVDLSGYDAVILAAGRYIGGPFYDLTLDSARDHVRAGKPLWQDGGEIGYEISHTVSTICDWWSENIMGVEIATTDWSDDSQRPWYMYSGDASSRTVITGLGDHPTLQTPHPFYFPFQGIRIITLGISNYEAFGPMATPPSNINYLTTTFIGDVPPPGNSFDMSVVDGIVDGGSAPTRTVVTHFTIENENVGSSYGFFTGSTNNYYLTENIITWMLSGSTNPVIPVDLIWLRGNKDYRNILGGFRNYWS